MFFEILLEGASDVPVVRDIFVRFFNLTENINFRIHPHRGKGKIPKKVNLEPDPKQRGLLDQLPAKLRGYSYLPDDYYVIVLVDADNDDCILLKETLIDLYRKLEKRPKNTIFRIAVEETESWFLADKNAIINSYPNAKINILSGIKPDEIIGAWEYLARVIGLNPNDCDGGDKIEWAEKISPYLNYKTSKSPSLNAFIKKIEKILNNK